MGSVFSSSYSVLHKVAVTIFSNRKKSIDSVCANRVECLPKPPFATEDDLKSSKIIAIVSVNSLVAENGLAHRTSRYEIMNRSGNKAGLVIRRGQEFYLNVKLTRNYDPTIDGISIVLALDGVAHPTYGHGTLVAIPVLDAGEKSEGSWQANVDAIRDHSIRIKIVPPANAFIGKWILEIDTKRKDSDDAISFTLDEPVSIIFNPWCKDDPVYLENEEERQEYVLADTGMIWRGDYFTSVNSSIWKFSQFEKDILECAFYLMIVVGKVRINGRNDPVVICRCLSAACFYVLLGHWNVNSKITDGVNPLEWLGSREILQEYYRTKERVKYGQCWVFAGVLGTICRALGIPCRIVTNFLSAHDTESSLTMDHLLDDKGNDNGKDMYWNFHVWNEVWMKRLDLSSEYSGWQVIDGTPQERSEGEFRCGPSPVAAVKEGEILKPYDTAFVFAEVNSDEIYWRCNGPSKPMKLIRRDINKIGKLISTKAVGKWERQDLTDTYKYPEKTQEERDIMLKALRQANSSISRYYLNEEFNDIVFDLVLQKDVVIGQPFRVEVRMTNLNNTEQYEVSAFLKVETIVCRGEARCQVKDSNTKVLVAPKSSTRFQLDVSWEDYSTKLRGHNDFNVACFVKVDKIDFEHYICDNLIVRNPDVEIKLKNKARVGERLEATAEFVNPLPIPLRKGKFIVYGTGISEHLELKLYKNVEVGKIAKCSFSMTPDLEGKFIIAVKFFSMELQNVGGFIEFMVKHK